MLDIFLNFVLEKFLKILNLLIFENECILNSLFFIIKFKCDLI